jgi:alkylated DNA nucleotide flippase Atl1
MAKKTWEEKLQDSPDYPKILKLTPKLPCYKAAIFLGAKEGDEVVITKKSEVLEVMKKIPKGKLITIHEMCKILAENHNVQACSSLTTGIFIMTVANAEEELKADFRGYGVPYWRTLKAEGELNPKYPGGIEGHKTLLEEEGFTVIPKGRSKKRMVVKDYEKYLISM